MIVEVEDAVFAMPNVMDLVQLFRLTTDGRHVLLIDPPFEPEADRALNRWLTGQSETLRDEVLLQLEEGPKAAVTGASPRRRVRVTTGAERWAPDACLQLGKALALLERPLKVLIENRRSDRGLLLKGARADQAEWLRSLEAHRWLEWDSGGGHGELEKVVDHSDETARLRMWVMIDSDARWGYVPSKAATRCQGRCAPRLPAGGFHMLRRRTNENYLPPQALHAWALRHKGGQRSHPIWSTYQTWLKFDPEQRHHYNVREGFGKDRRGGHTLPAGFGTLTEHADLQKGFGEEVTTIWLETHPMDEAWFLRDGSADELQSLVHAIFEAL